MNIGSEVLPTTIEEYYSNEQAVQMQLYRQRLYFLTPEGLYRSEMSTGSSLPSVEAIHKVADTGGGVEAGVWAYDFALGRVPHTDVPDRVVWNLKSFDNKGEGYLYAMGL